MIDLHGLSIERALPRIELAIREGIEKGFPSIEIMTGKGTGTLKVELESYLIDNGYKFDILNGGGLYKVYLK